MIESKPSFLVLIRPENITKVLPIRVVFADQLWSQADFAILPPTGTAASDRTR